MQQQRHATTTPCCQTYFEVIYLKNRKVIKDFIYWDFILGVISLRNSRVISKPSADTLGLTDLFLRDLDDFDLKLLATLI